MQSKLSIHINGGLNHHRDSGMVWNLELTSLICNYSSPLNEILIIVPIWIELQN